MRLAEHDRTRCQDYSTLAIGGACHATGVEWAACMDGHFVPDDYVTYDVCSQEQSGEMSCGEFKASSSCHGSGVRQDTLFALSSCGSASGGTAGGHCHHTGRPR